MKKENKTKFIKINLIEEKKVVETISLPMTKGFVEIIKKWLDGETKK